MGSNRITSTIQHSKETSPIWPALAVAAQTPSLVGLRASFFIDGTSLPRIVTDFGLI